VIASRYFFIVGSLVIAGGVVLGPIGACVVGGSYRRGELHEGDFSPFETEPEVWFVAWAVLTGSAVLVGGAMLALAVVLKNKARAARPIRR
jgi:hypothetical protein